MDEWGLSFWEGNEDNFQPLPPKDALIGDSWTYVLWFISKSSGWLWLGPGQDVGPSEASLRVFCVFWRRTFSLWSLYDYCHRMWSPWLLMKILLFFREICCKFLWNNPVNEPLCQIFILQHLNIHQLIYFSFVGQIFARYHDISETTRTCSLIL